MERRNGTKMTLKKSHLVSFCGFGLYLSFWRRKFSLLPSADLQSTKIERFNYEHQQDLNTKVLLRE